MESKFVVAGRLPGQHSPAAYRERILKEAEDILLDLLAEGFPETEAQKVRAAINRAKARPEEWWVSARNTGCSAMEALLEA